MAMSWQEVVFLRSPCLHPWQQSLPHDFVVGDPGGAEMAGRLAW